MNSERYARQSKLIGEKEQLFLKNKKVMIVGCGGLGSAAAELLLRSGVENLTLIDEDKIELTNLARQLLYEQKDIGKYKAKVAKEKLLKINSKAKIKDKILFLDQHNLSLLKSDLILDCTDNLETRFWINDYCYKNNLPWIYASAIRWEGYVMLIQPKSPCLSCFLKKGNIETCNQQGIISTLPTTIASLQSTLAIRYLLGEKVTSELFYFNLKKMELKTLNIKKNPKCPTCGKF
ncbi:MAG: HesA/MoeB/ThiF family protein [Candidatus Woesearchaeota archaeon]